MAAKKQWKRVLYTLPSGEKAYRYTDGQGNYRISHPDTYESMESRRGLSKGRSGPGIRTQLSQLAGPAGGETRTARVKGVSSKEESKEPSPSKPELKIKPKPKPEATKPKPKPKPEATKPKPKPKPTNTAEVKPAKPSVQASEQKPTVVRNPSPKPQPKADSKPTAKASETYRDGGKGLYQGTKEYRDKVGGSGNPLLNRFRRDMGRDATTGERLYSTPDEKSKYVDKNNKLKIQDKPKPADTNDEQNRGNAAFIQNSVNRLSTKETPEQRKKREKREMNRNIA